MAKITLAKTNRVAGTNENGNGKPATPPIVDAYKGQPILVLNPDSHWPPPFRFGPYKAKLILANLEYVKQFVAEYGSHEEQE